MRTTITILVSDKEPKIISPGVRQGATYRVIDEGPDYFKILLHGKPVFLDKTLVGGRKVFDS